MWDDFAGSFSKSLNPHSRKIPKIFITQNKKKKLSQFIPKPTLLENDGNKWIQITRNNNKIKQ
jgi:hypothetical protein